jgi:hypothetical protein
MHSFDGSKNSDSKTATFIHFTKPRSCMRWLYWWGWEVGGCIGSFAAFLAVVGLLRSFDGKPQPEWPYGITLNSAVAWLTTIGKSCLLVPAAACISQCLWINYSRNAHDLVTIASYDAASRGPWGSLELLWALKAK